MALELVPKANTQIEVRGFSDDQQQALQEALPTNLIKERKGPGGRMLKYISGKTSIDAANRIFGFGKWGYHVLSKSHEKCGDTEYYTADIELYVLGCPFPFPGEGVGVVTSNNVEGHEKARKEAVTDAMKRALRHFGDQFGLCLYSEDALVEDGNGNLIQVKDAHPANKQQTQQSGGKQQQSKKTVDAEPTIDQLKALCDELFGTGKWAALRARILNAEEIGDIPDDMLSQAQKAKINGALVAHKRQKASQASTGK